VIRKHWFVLLQPVLITLVLIVFSLAVYELKNNFYFFVLAGLSAIWLIYKWMDRRNNLWAVTNLRIIDEYGVFSNNSKETPLDKINNVSYHQPLLGRIFNYGNVQIQSAAESGATVIKMVESPEALKDAITKYREIYKRELIKMQSENRGDDIDKQSSYEKKGIVEELVRLNELKEKGIITEAEFQQGKEKILKG